MQRLDARVAHSGQLLSPLSYRGELARGNPDPAAAIVAIESADPGYDWMFPEADQWDFLKMHADVTAATRAILKETYTIPSASM